MAVQMTYTSLYNDISSYLERTDAATLAKIPTFIMLAEQTLASEIKFLGNLTVNESNMVSGNPVITKPARWRKTVSMKIDGEPVLHRSQEYVAQYQSESAQGKPKYYADYDYDHWALAPVPDDDYQVQIIYYSRIQPLDETNQQNLLTREAPQAILFGTLLQTQGYLKSPDKLQLWQQMYKNAMDALKAENTSRNIDRNTTVSEP